MINEELKKSNEIIAKFIGYEQSKIEPDFWYCGNYGLTVLKFHEDWDWLMTAIAKIQRGYDYQMRSMPYDLKEESINLSKYIKSL